MPNPNTNRPSPNAPLVNEAGTAEVSVEPSASAAPASAKLIEVELLRKYAPVKFTNDDGELLEQGEIKVAYPKGTVLKLPADEAQHALKAGIASVTANTFAG